MDWEAESYLQERKQHKAMFREIFQDEQRRKNADRGRRPCFRVAEINT